MTNIPIFNSATNSYSVVVKSNPKDKISVVVGDDKQPDKFFPQIKIVRWDNEVNFSARLIHDEKSPIVSTEANKIIWDGEKIALNYSVSENGYKAEIILKEKQSNNIISFTLEDKGVDYFYQPKITQEEIDSGCSQPENVVGSYAVYTSENKINYVDGKKYGVGKVGHLYRPFITDSAGNIIWGKLHIENKIMSIEIPEEFFNKAIYPIRIR